MLKFLKKDMLFCSTNFRFEKIQEEKVKLLAAMEWSENSVSEKNKKYHYWLSDELTR